MQYNGERRTRRKMKCEKEKGKTQTPITSQPAIDQEKIRGFKKKGTGFRPSSFLM